VEGIQHFLSVTRKETPRCRLRLRRVVFCGCLELVSTVRFARGGCILVVHVYHGLSSAGRIEKVPRIYYFIYIAEGP